MLAYEPHYRTPETLTEIPTGFREATELAFEEGLSYNPTRIIADVMQKGTGSNDMVSNKEAGDLAKSLGVDISESLTGGDNAYIDRGAVYMLAERKYQSQKRQELLANGPSGISGLGASLTGNLAASFLDPIGFASNFIPFVGQAKYAALLGKAGASVIGRTGVRMAVGAAEGAAGNLILEPIVYSGANALGEEYTLRDSALSVAIGGIMGGTLHSIIGMPSDFRDAATFKKVEAERIAKEAKDAEELKNKERLKALREQKRTDEEKALAAKELDRELLQQQYLDDLQKRQEAEYKKTLEDNQDVFALDKFTPDELINIEHAATAMALAGKDVDIDSVIKLQVASKAARLDAAKKIDPIAFKAVDDALARVTELKKMIVNQEQQFQKSFPSYVVNRLNQIEEELANSNLSGKKRMELLKEEADLKKYTETAFFDADIANEVEPTERHIEYLKGEIKRINDGLNAKEFKSRVSKAYHLASQEIKAGRTGDVIATSSDKSLDDFLNGRISAEEIAPLVAAEKINIDAEVNKHADLWMDRENSSVIDKPMLTKAQEAKVKAKQKELVSLSDEINELAADLEYTAKLYNLNSEDLTKGIDSLKETSAEAQEIATTLASCFVGVK